MGVFEGEPPTSWHVVRVDDLPLSDEGACAALAVGQIVAGFVNASLRGSLAEVSREPLGRPEIRSYPIAGESRKW